MKGRIFLSGFCGVLFAIAAYLIFSFLFPEIALPLSVATGLLFALLLFPALLLHEKIMNKKYGKFEATLRSPVFCKASGNFRTEEKVRNGNIYFCEEGIVFASLDEKPLAAEELLLQDIEKYQFDKVHMNIYTKDGRVYSIATADAPQILEILKEKNWIT